MIRVILTAALVLVAPVAHADRVDSIIETQILPDMAALATSTTALDAAAQADCDPGSETLQTAFLSAFADWTRISHLRFGPVEKDNRGFALAFWPEPRAQTSKTLAALLSAADPVIDDPDSFSQVSVAVQGLYALEYMLFDARMKELGDPACRCAMVRAIAANAARIAGAIADEWATSHADLLRNPTPDGPYQTIEEATQELFKAVLTGLQINADLRLGRPLGSIDKPRPKRAEARRSGQSLAHVVISVIALQDLATALAEGDTDLTRDLDAAFRRALEEAEALDDPVFAGVATPTGRIRVEALQQRINEIRQIAQSRLGPSLGVAAGFNSLDGD